MPEWLLIFLAIFANYRLAELVSVDTISEPLRAYPGKRVTPEEKDGWWWLAELLNCPYCMGVWFAAVLALLIILLEPGSPVLFFFYWLGIAGGQAILEAQFGRA